LELPLHERLTRLAIRDEQGRSLPSEETPLARALNGEVLSEERAMDLRVRTLDGREIELRVRAAPIRAPTGQLIGAVSVYRDVTEPNRLERTLAEQAEQLNRIFEGIADGLVVYDAEGQVLRANTTARRILGLDAAPADYSQASTHGRAVLYEAYDEEGRRLAPEEWPLIRVLQGLVADADARDVRLRVLDGREVNLHTSAAPLRDGSGRLIGAVSILHDQTERRRLERERAEVRTRELAMREVNQRLDIFVTMAAHDLRSPVAISRMVVHMAQARLERTAAGTDSGTDSALTLALDRAAEALVTTTNNLDRLWRLVQQLLDVARVKEGTLALNLQMIDLAELLRTCVAEQRMLNPSRVIALDLPAHAEVSSVIVNADVDRLNQVVTNYLSNAGRYSPEDQPITVALRLTYEEVPGVADAPADGSRERHMRPVARVEVCDHGVGIAEEDQVTIWDRFQRAASVDQASGLGLGLYIVRTIVELHRGRVGVQSMPGQGSTFWFTLPPLAPAMDAMSRDSLDDENAAP
jgi:PAS domain S-box-containing protein